MTEHLVALDALYRMIDDATAFASGLPAEVYPILALIGFGMIIFALVALIFLRSPERVAPAPRPARRGGLFRAKADPFLVRLKTLN